MFLGKHCSPGHNSNPYGAFCPAHYTLHTAYYTLHTTQCALHTTHCILNTRHCILNIWQCTRLSVQCTLYNVQQVRTGTAGAFCPGNGTGRRKGKRREVGEKRGIEGRAGSGILGGKEGVGGRGKERARSSMLSSIRQGMVFSCFKCPVFFNLTFALHSSAFSSIYMKLRYFKDRQNVCVLDKYLLNFLFAMANIRIIGHYHQPHI